MVTGDPDNEPAAALEGRGTLSRGAHPEAKCIISLCVKEGRKLPVCRATLRDGQWNRRVSVDEPILRD